MHIWQNVYTMNLRAQFIDPRRAFVWPSDQSLVPNDVVGRPKDPPQIWISVRCQIFATVFIPGFTPAILYMMLSYPCDFPSCTARSIVDDGGCTSCNRHLCSDHHLRENHPCLKETDEVSFYFPAYAWRTMYVRSAE